MEQRTIGTVIAVKKQWWLKINTKPVRTHSLDGAIFPHVIKVIYTVEGTPYTKRKWVPASHPIPTLGSEVTVLYAAEKPARAKIIL